MIDKHFWTNRYEQRQTGWDIGYPAPALCRIIDNLPIDSRILIPGAGNAWEAEYAWQRGHRHLTVIDISEIPLRNLASRCPTIPQTQLICCDFFAHTGQYDVILEQTFFCAIAPSLRPTYADQCFELLAHKGVVTGLLFNDPTLVDGPPYGGTMSEYHQLFGKKFEIEAMLPEIDSIKPRAGREVYFRLRKP